MTPDEIEDLKDDLIEREVMYEAAMQVLSALGVTMPEGMSNPDAIDWLNRLESEIRRGHDIQKAVRFTSMKFGYIRFIGWVE